MTEYPTHLNTGYTDQAIIKQRDHIGMEPTPTYTTTPTDDDALPISQAVKTLQSIASKLPCECLITGSDRRCGNCDFAPKLRPRLSLALADEVHDHIGPDVTE